MKLYFKLFIKYLLKISLLFLIAGCAHKTLEASYESSLEKQNNNYFEISGRMALTIEPENNLPDLKVQRFSAAFELVGNHKQGQLQLFTPLGTTLATLHWTPSWARMLTSNSLQQFASLDAMLHHATGAQLPAVGLFAWLSGEQADLPGWQVDLSQHAKGQINAQRLAPGPGLTLRMVLNRP